MKNIVSYRYSSTRWSAYERGEVKSGDVVTVSGCGSVGIMAKEEAWLHRASGMMGVDILEGRLAKTRAKQTRQLLVRKLLTRLKLYVE